MITIITDKAANGLGQNMCGIISKKRQDIKHFPLDDMKIGPCYACRGCEEKTYGRCVVRDDADLILPFLSRSQIIIVFTTIVFGGYSFEVKRALDKIGLVVDRHYYYHNGELVKGKPSGVKYYVIGIHDGVDMEEVKVFKQLVTETLKITAWEGGSIIMPYDADNYNSLIQEVAEL